MLFKVFTSLHRDVPHIVIGLITVIMVGYTCSIFAIVALYTEAGIKYNLYMGATQIYFVWRI
jgi:ABC-type phosphate/phosphonate transport system permease subunit